MYKVFINHQPIHFTIPAFAPLAGGSDVIIHQPDTTIIYSIIEEAEQQKGKRAVWFISDDPEHVFQSFCTYYDLIHAAGGLVRNDRDEFLFIFRMGRWDLPKGKAEPGELAEETAVREVEEETGVRHLMIISELPSTYHTYKLHDRRILKHTRWFEMYCDGRQVLKPQTAEDISNACWLGSGDLEQVMNNTYPSLTNLLKSVQKSSGKLP